MLELEQITATDGEFFIIKNDTHVGAAMRIMGRWERQLLEYIEPFLKPDFTILDAGANIGTHTIFFAKRCYQVMAFDIIPDFVEIVKMNVNLNKLNNVQAYNIGLSDRQSIWTD
jgi:tRNA/tmRNA/rRNA uracil-C5-methylase (TrmA/RlmC/RlmD family)